MNIESHPRRGEQIVWRRGEDGVVLLNPGDGEYFSLDDVGGRIWELCDGERSVGEIATVIATEYEADASVIQADAIELLGELEADGLVALD